MLQFCLENHWDIPTIEKALKVIAKIYSRLSIASKVNLLGSSLLINYLKAISSQAKAAQSSSHTSCVVRPFNLISFDKLVTNIIQLLISWFKDALTLTYVSLSDDGCKDVINSACESWRDFPESDGKSVHNVSSSDSLHSQVVKILVEQRRYLSTIEVSGNVITDGIQELNTMHSTLCTRVGVLEDEVRSLKISFENLPASEGS